MGFCRRCGDIVAHTKCKCGGTAVAPVVAFKDMKAGDRWSNTYVNSSSNNDHREKAISQPPSPTRRFPRPRSPLKPLDQTGNGSRVSSHIASATSNSNIFPSPAKPSITPKPESGILPSPSPYNGALSKVYGSVLQPKESLATHSCARCRTTFKPDSTIYPDPTAISDSSVFLCRPCFSTNGGSKGPCTSCGRAVLSLKTEGCFVHAAGQYWHEKCFNCEGCFKNIGNSPMVDLLGRPSCANCFEDCLRRDTTPRKSYRSATNSPGSNIGGMSKSANTPKSQAGSPAIEELEQRLGILKFHDSSPQLPDNVGTSSPRQHRSMASSLGNTLTHSRTTESPKEKQRLLSRTSFLEERTSSSDNITLVTPTKVSHSRNIGSPALLSTHDQISPSHPSRFSPTKDVAPLSPSDFSTPDLLSDSSDTATISSGPDSPPNNDCFDSRVYTPSSMENSYGSRYTKTSFLDEMNGSRQVDYSPTRKHQHIQSYNSVLYPRSPSLLSAKETMEVPLSPSTSCEKCHMKLFTRGRDSDFIAAFGQTYHVSCFTCAVCDQGITPSVNGRASFATSPNGPCHAECVLITMGFSTNTTEISLTTSNGLSSPVLSSRHEPPGQPVVPSSPRRFGSSSTCPGCQKLVSPMERGVVPGPQGTKWHTSCLVCGGKKVGKLERGRPPRRKDQPGCGKLLDSAAKGDGEGGIWCRECLLLLTSQTRARPTGDVFSVGANNTIIQQYTGTTIARQFTGTGGNQLLRQMTGGLSPTRSISPKKQLGTIGPRPKSVIGMSHSKSVDGGRGMFLVRQMTGTRG